MMITRQLLEHLNSPAICASFCKLMRFNNSVVTPNFMKYFLKLYHSLGLVSLFQIQSTGISNYQFESFLKYQELRIPPMSLLTKFDEHIEPIINKQENLKLANASLHLCRQSLLGRLIGGKLNVDQKSILHNTVEVGYNIEELAHA